MPGGLLGGGAAGANGSPAQIFLPPGQSEVAGQLGSTIAPLQAVAANAGAGTPAAQNFPFAQNAVAQFLTGGQDPSQTPYPDLINRAFNPAYAAADYASSTLFPRGTGQSAALSNLGGGGIPLTQAAANYGFDPAYGQAISGLQNNPHYQEAQNAAEQGASLGRLGANNVQSGADQVGSTISQLVAQGFNPAYGQAVAALQNNPYYQQAQNAAQASAQLGAQGAGNIQNAAGQIGGSVPAMQQTAGQLAGGVSPLLQAGYDPQAALYNRSRGQLLDQSNAINAMSGLAGSPYGASSTANALGNFDINWQNNQLQREAQAAGAAGSLGGAAGNLYGQAGQAANTAAGLYAAAPGLVASTGAAPSNAYTSNIGQTLAGLAAQNQAGVQGAGAAGQAADRSGLLYSMAPGIATTSGAAPSNTFTGNINQILSGLAARNQGASQGLANYASGTGTIGSAFQGAQGLGAQGANLASQFGAAPYNLGAGVANNAIQGLTNSAVLGNNQYSLPQQVIGDFEQYLGLGQSASQINAQLGQMGVNQQAQALGGIGSAIGLGSNLLGLGGGGGGLLGGLGGGLGAGGATGLGEAAFGLGSLGAGAGATVDAGAGSFLSSALPFALSA